MRVTPEVLIIGYGNPLRRDDGLGWAAAEALAGDARLAAARIETAHQLAWEMAEPISRAGLLILLDAERGQPAGRVVHRQLPDAEPEPAPLTHHVAPGTLIRFARQLYGHAPEAHLFTAGGADFGYGQGLSREAQAAVAAVVRRVYETIKLYSSKPERGILHEKT